MHGPENLSGYKSTTTSCHSTMKGSHYETTLSQDDRNAVVTHGRLLTQGLNIKPLTHTHFSCQKGGSCSSSTGRSSGCFYLSTLASRVLQHLPTVGRVYQSQRPLFSCAARCGTEEPFMLQTQYSLGALQGFLSVCDLCLHAAAEGSAGVQHISIIHACECIE